MKEGAISRRSFTWLAATSAAVASFPAILRAADQQPILGQGEFRYRVVPDWGNLGSSTPVANCHGIVCDREGNLILLTDEVKNNFIVYSPDGKLLHKWGTAFPGAHGLSLVEEGGKEILYFTDLKRHRVFKSTTTGEILHEWGWPEQSGKYPKEDDYKPSWTLHLPNGEFIVLDGYGKDYFLHYSTDGKLLKTFGGNENGIVHWGPHGGMVDQREKESSLLIAMSDQQYILRLDLDGKEQQRILLPGGNPRQIRRMGKHFIVAHLADNWPTDRNSRGFLSVLDESLRVVSNIGGTAPVYDTEGKLQKMKQEGNIFLHPHDVTPGKDGSLYVAQFASNNTYPIKLERA